MPLTPTQADALATAICSALGVTDTASKAKWQNIAELFYSHLVADITVTIAALSIVTTGSAATQTGPAAPLPVPVT